MNRKIFILAITGLFVSCSGLDDLIFDRHPQLSDFYVSSPRVAPFDTVLASVIATNPIEGVLEYKWTIDPERGNFIGPTDLDSVQWVAPIQGGVYELTVRVDNTAKYSELSKQIEVIVSERPFVDILMPKSGAYFVVGQSFQVEARAEHANGLSWVRAYINEKMMAEQDQNTTGIYQFNLTADSSMIGTAVLKLEAKSAASSMPGSDWINIQIGGIIAGKNGS